MVVLFCATAKVDTSAPSPGICNNRCLDRWLWRVYEQPVLQEPVARKKGLGDPQNFPRAKDCLEYMSTIKKGDQGESCLLQGRQHNRSVPSVEGGQQPLHSLARKILLRCPKDRVMVYQECPGGVAIFRADTLSWGREAQEWNIGILICQSLLRWCRIPVVDIFVSKRAFKVPKYSSVDLSDNNTLGGDILKVEWLGSSRCTFWSPNKIQLVLGRLVKWRGTDHGHTLLARPVVVPKSNETGNRITKEVPALRIATVECNIRGSNP